MGQNLFFQSVVYTEGVNNPDWNFLLYILVPQDITDRLLPAVAKLAQDGSQEARLFAKMTLRTLMAHPDFERVLKKHVTANTLRNLEKILEQLAAGGTSSQETRVSSKGSRASRKTL